MSNKFIADNVILINILIRFLSKCSRRMKRQIADRRTVVRLELLTSLQNELLTEKNLNKEMAE